MKRTPCTQLHQASRSHLHRHLRTHLSAALIAFAALLVLAPLHARAQDDGMGQLGPQAQAIAQAINAIRTQNGLNALNVNPLLNQAAQGHVDDLIAHGMYGHYGSDGSNVRMRVLRTGYASGLVSENWVTSGSTDGAMTWWMNDWIHKVNILDTSWDEVGVGVGQVGNGYYIYVTDFANADGKDTSIAVTPPSEAEATYTDNSESLPAEGLDYTIRGGDTLLAIGLRYGIEWQDIALANDMAEDDILSIGRTLHIPGRGAAEGDSSRTVAEGGLLYTVSSGDTLITIAKRYAIDWHDIEAANRLSDYSILQIGMQLRLPGVPEAEADADANAAADAAPAPAAKAKTVTITQFSAASYVVRAGDTLYTIAARNDCTWQALADINGLGEDALLQIGQKLSLPPTETEVTLAAEAAPAATPAAIAYTTELLPAAPDAIEGAPAVAGGATPLAAGGPAPLGRSYTVQPGDTIISIAVRNNIGWKELLRLNGLSDDSLLQPGQVLALGN